MYIMRNYSLYVNKKATTTKSGLIGFFIFRHCEEPERRRGNLLF